MNGIIIIDKPEGWTSFDVIAKLRGILREKRIGHSGTLDPMATGVLPVFIGRATRAVEFCESHDKEYIAGLRLGVVTDTQDMTGNILSSADVRITRPEVERAVLAFIGAQEQLPPMYSAIKIGGQKLYELARRGIETERAMRHIVVETIEVLEQNNNDYLLRVVCSKGTYIRTLCHDIGRLLGCGGTMSSLRRVRAGNFYLRDAVSLTDVAETVNSGDLGQIMRPLDTVFAQYPAVFINTQHRTKCLNGTDFPLEIADGLYRVYDEASSFMMLGCADSGIMKTVKSFFIL